MWLNGFLGGRGGGGGQKCCQNYIYQEVANNRSVERAMYLENFIVCIFRMTKSGMAGIRATHWEDINAYGYLIIVF
jgi:hypothetical protein